MQDSLQILNSAIAYLDLIIDREIVTGHYFKGQLRDAKEILEAEFNSRKIDTTKIDISKLEGEKNQWKSMY
jgi:hypothetical protein